MKAIYHNTKYYWKVTKHEAEIISESKTRYKIKLATGEVKSVQKENVCIIG